MACNHQKHPGKKLIVCCDGTWQNSDNGYQTTGMFTNPKLQVPSNVTRMCRAITTDACSSSVAQVVYYQAGVGTGLGLWDKLVGGGTGLGLSENIREAYAFIAHNYEQGDEIYLVGFSRGAFTARSIAGLIGKIGLLTKTGLASFYEIFKDYENEFNPYYRPQFPDVPYEKKGKISDPVYAKTLEDLKLSRLGIPVKAVAVWDTVGSLGIPNVNWLRAMGIGNPSWEYAFHDTKLGSHIENAFQALALDEHRGPFSPAVWDKPQGVGTFLKQCWFPGEHSNTGGGQEDNGCADITMAWMMDQLSPFIDFDEEYLAEQWQICQQYYKTTRQVPRPWGTGKIYNSAGGIFALAGNIDRTPGHYFHAYSTSGRASGTPMEQTNETIHSSTRLRLGRAGLGEDDKGAYKPVALKEWKLVVKKSDSAGESEMRDQAWWEYQGRSPGAKILREEPLGRWERELLRHEPKMYEELVGELPETNGTG